ncbi:Phenylalanyl-tRNA synthetase beta chain [Labilithrix luteola]|uniref:Phenylalanine--tRNA ligase beta subunit n=1 Tax=Labilithrix luteola TaxID=1391654 RepID=A0A0K1PML7_9BACT|nr:phenylalanine--tRNA ligase subunit beta [Labilithrix luteola]AKU94359.1 Phenylalanyl-tRNA synthetase beta chain [Labilithrix luteola]
MKASYRWLRELVPQLEEAKHSPRELAARLTASGLEVEGITEFGEAADACIVVRVVSMRPHPTKSGLRLVTVERGGGATQEVVCGAPNVPDPGGLVVLAPLGARLPAVNLTIAKRAIGGVESEGMLCSEEELGLGEGHEGIIVLPVGIAEPGTKLSQAVPNMRDTVLEIGLTPNRPDGLGHVGLAREICALYGFPFAWPSSGVTGKTSSQATSDVVSITVDDAERCPHYGAAGAVGVKIGASPLAIRYRLAALGVRSISNVVDVTNVVMLEFGHPMHAFDLDRVRGARVVVRRANDGEKLTTLDGVERTLVADDLLICDGEGPVALAGIMGGASSEIQSDTKRVLFEVAWFDPRGIRRSGRRHAMHTESSHRFERGVDPGDVSRVLDRAVSLTLELAGGEATKGQIHVQGARTSPEPTQPLRRSIHFRARRMPELLGVDVPFAEAKGILERLGCEVTAKDDAEADVIVPTHRPDLTREVDLVEEVIRVRGMDAVPAELPAIRASRDVGGREELSRRARQVAVGIGLSEAITFGFTSTSMLATLSAPTPTVVLANPLGEHHAVMRTTVLPGLLDAVRNARRHGQRDVREFTIGSVFLARDEKSGKKDDELPNERLRIGMVLAGERPGWLGKPKDFDAWDIKGYASALLAGISGEAVSVVPATRDTAPGHLHPRGAAFLEVNGTRVGTFGILHPDVVDALELDGEVLVAEIDMEPFAAGPKTPQYAAIPRFPASPRDASFAVKDAIPAGEVEQVVRAAAGPLAVDVKLFDRFVGGNLPEGYSSLTFRVVYRANDRTLTDAEVDAAHANVHKEVETRLGATLR